MIASTPEALRRRKTTAVIVGGSTVVAALTAIGVSGGFDRLVKRSGEAKQASPQVLRSGSILSIAPSSSSIPSQRPLLRTSRHAIMPMISSSATTSTARPSETPSIKSTPSDAASSSTSLRPSDIPTSEFGKFTSNRSLQMITDAPSTANVPTTKPTSSPTSVSTTGQPTTTKPTSGTILSNPTDESNKGTFRIRMHWQAGYMWQEVPDEGWFCLACARCDLDNLFLGLKGCNIETQCEENMHLALTGCDPSKLGPSKLAEIATFKFLFDEAEDGLDGDQIQVQGTNFCVQQVLPGGTGSVVLRQCDASLKAQRFWGARPVGKAMELLPLVGNSAKCLTNHHHPRQAEQVYAEDCDLARLPDTSYWCPFFPENGTIGSCDVVTASPTMKPTRMPVTSKPSTTRPTRTPTNPPTSRPTKIPTVPPTSRPTKVPTLPPTTRPTKVPTLPPTSRPTKVLTLPPTSTPTKAPTASQAFVTTAGPAPSSLFD